MIKDLHLTNFTCFAEARLSFGKQLNLIVGENGLGKTHLLKVAYSMIALSAEEGRQPGADAPTKTLLQQRCAEKLINVFRPESLGRLARRRQGRARCDVRLGFHEPDLDIAFDFATNSKKEVSIQLTPKSWVPVAPVYLPTRELLTIYPNFISVYEGHYLELEENWRDLALLLGAPAQRGPRENRIRQLLKPLEQAMDGTMELDQNGRFYLRNANGRLEMPLVAEGLRKLGMLARLIATGALLDKGYLFWDEPEANLNPRLIKQVARTLVEIAASGIQVILATHSLFLLRELEILMAGRRRPLDTGFFGLHATDAGVAVKQGGSADDIGDITMLDEELLQSDRFLAEDA